MRRRRNCEKCDQISVDETTRVCDRKTRHDDEISSSFKNILIHIFSCITDERDKAGRSLKFVLHVNLPGVRMKIEKTITDNTAEMTRSAMQIPRQLRFSVDEMTISCNREKSDIIRNVIQIYSTSVRFRFFHTVFLS